MTNNVFGGTLNLTQSTLREHVCVYVETENVSIQTFTVTHDGHPALLRRFFVISAQ